MIDLSWATPSIFKQPESVSRITFSIGLRLSNVNCKYFSWSFPVHLKTFRVGILPFSSSSSGSTAFSPHLAACQREAKPKMTRKASKRSSDENVEQNLANYLKRKSLLHQQFLLQQTSPLQQERRPRFWTTIPSQLWSLLTRTLHFKKGRQSFLWIRLVELSFFDLKHLKDDGSRLFIGQSELSNLDSKSGPQNTLVEWLYLRQASILSCADNVSPDSGVLKRPAGAHLSLVHANSHNVSHIWLSWLNFNLNL